MKQGSGYWVIISSWGSVWYLIPSYGTS
ncbi:hypothetical protein Godav_006028 [Gossypium davidsonii]|uniref:Uncharacterized protein n=1 Tax=Gossypium davidsonii TaxID=34287 RepID=A0A7J8S2D8_GOSDV|nr:hypothetical protein [Gossypium davidsonii]